MSYLASALFLKDLYRKKNIPVPTLHIVLGSGLAGSQIQSEKWALLEEVSFKSLPGFSNATVPGHAGVFRFYQNQDTKKTLTIQVGRIHGYEGHSAKDAVRPVMASRLAGTMTFILTNAAGGIDKSFQVGSVMAIRDHVNLTGQNPLIGEITKDLTGKPIGARFPDMSQTYDKTLTENLKHQLSLSGIQVHEGVYLGLLGPSFETPAEISTFGLWGMHAVGMSTVWEAIALKHSGAGIAGLSFISNAACGVGELKALSHDDILKATEKAADGVVRSLFDFSEMELAK